MPGLFKLAAMSTPTSSTPTPSALALGAPSLTRSEAHAG